MLEKCFEAETRGGAGSVCGEERARKICGLELDELAEREAGADRLCLDIEGTLEPGPTDEEIFLGPDEPGVEVAGEGAHAFRDADEGLVLERGSGSGVPLVFELLDPLVRVSKSEEGPGDGQSLVDPEVLCFSLKNLVVLAAPAGFLRILERFLQFSVQLLLMAASLALVVQLRRLLQPRQDLCQPLERLVLPLQ